MLNPILAIRRKASSFRENRNKPVVVRRNSRCVAKANPPPRPPSIDLDPRYSLENFISNLDAVKHFPRSVKSQPSMPTAVSRPQAKASPLDKLNDASIQAILRALPSQDVRSARLVCRRLNQLVSMTDGLARKRLRKLQVNFDGSGRAYRGNLRQSHLCSEIPEKSVDEPLRFVTTTKVLLENAVLDAAGVDLLKKGLDYQLDEIVFNFCHFKLSSCGLSRLLEYWRPRRVAVVNCEWRGMDSVQTASIGDSLFITNPQIEHFTFANSNFKKALLTDRTPALFRRLPRLPTSIDLSGCSSKITAQGLAAAIEAYTAVALESVQTASTPLLFKWCFGQLADTRDVICKRLRLIPVQGRVVVNTESLIELRFRPNRTFPPLCVAFGFREEDPFFSSDDNISYDDSDDELFDC